MREKKGREIERERELEPELNIGWGGDRRGSRSVIPVFLGLALRLKDEENKPERKAERGRRWRRICETSLRKYAQLNFSTPSAFPRLPIPFSSRPLPFTLSPSDSRPGLSLSSPSLLLFLFFPLDLCLVPSVTLPCSLLLSSLLSLTLSLSLVSLLLASLPFYLALSLSLFLPPLPPPARGPFALLSRHPCSRCPTLFATPRRSIIPQSRTV